MSLVAARNNVRSYGEGKRSMVFAHGLGCDQDMWRFIAPAFAADFQTVLFDHVGAGGSELSAFDPVRYGSLSGYADDLIEIVRDLRLKNIVFVGHSVSCMIGVLASITAPGLFDSLVLVGPSPCYINDAAYHGGFSAEDIEELLQSMDDNYLGWSAAIAPVIMANPDRPELADELLSRLCRTDPALAKAFARVTFTSDNRADLTRVNTRSLILQCSEDVIASTQVGEFVHRSIAGSTFVQMRATGHCPHLSAPAETIAAMRAFV